MGKVAPDAFVVVVVVSLDRLVATDNIICGVSDDDETLNPGGTMLSPFIILPEEPSAARALLPADCFKDVDEYVGTAVG